MGNKRVYDTFPNIGDVSHHYAMHRTHTHHTVAVRRCLRALRPIINTFDAIYCTGLSGIVPAATVAFKLKKDLLILRKVDRHGATNSHGMTREGECQFNADVRYIILDDFISGGGTLRRLLSAMPRDGSLAGILLYAHARIGQEKREGYIREVAMMDSDKPPAQWAGTWRVVRRGHTSMLFDLQRPTQEEKP